MISVSHSASFEKAKSKATLEFLSTISDEEITELSNALHRVERFKNAMLADAGWLTPDGILGVDDDYKKKLIKDLKQFSIVINKDNKTVTLTSTSAE